MRAILPIGALLLLVVASRTVVASGPGYVPDVPPDAGGYDHIRTIASKVPIPGFASFAQTVAYTESRGNIEAHNSSAHERSAARRLYVGARSRGFFANNPHQDLDAWALGSGGWFGLLPSTGLAAGGKNGPFANVDPRSIFRPIESIVMLADLVVRLVTRYGALDWLSVRRGMASPGLVRDVHGENRRSRGVQKRMREAMVKLGIPESFAEKRPDVSSYPGAARLYQELLGKLEVS
jgi:hypothetical protein